MLQNTPGFPDLHCLLEFVHSCSLSVWCCSTISPSLSLFCISCSFLYIWNRLNDFFLVKYNLLSLVQGLDKKKKVANLYYLFQKVIRISRNFLNLLGKYSPLLIVKTSKLNMFMGTHAGPPPSVFRLGRDLHFASFLLFSVDYEINSTRKETLLWTCLFRVVFHREKSWGLISWQVEAIPVDGNFHEWYL